MALTGSVVQRPGPARERILAPDLARGFMLLLIALANTPWYFWGQEHGPTTVTPVDGSVLDHVTQFALSTGVLMRVYPMFAFLFGYGIVQILNRQTAAGGSEAAARSVVQRRNLWLLVFGLVHAALLWGGDILGAYGVTGLLMVWLFLRRRDRTLLLASAVGVGVLVLGVAAAVVGAALSTGDAQADTEGGFNFMAWVNQGIAQADPWAAIVDRLTVWPAVVFGQGLFMLGVPVAILLGFWAARRRILEEPRKHLSLLRRTAVIGIAIGWGSGAVEAAAGRMGVSEAWSTALFVLSIPAGLACGLGYIAVFGLVGHRLRGRSRQGIVTTAVSAVGKRSLSCYLAQSVICAPLLAAWGLGFGAHLNSFGMAAFAVGAWLVTVAGAYAMERAGRRGPAEILLRRLAYRS